MRTSIKMAQERSSSPVIQRILGKWKSSHCVYYLVKWEDGYPDTWERSDDVNKQKDMVDDFRAWAEEKNLKEQTRIRGSFRPEAKTSTVKHGLTTAMLKYVLCEKQVKSKHSSQNSNNNASKVNGSKRNRKAKNNSQQADASKTKTSKVNARKERTKEAIKVVSKPKNVKNPSLKTATAKINAARSKAVKVLTKSKVSPTKKQTAAVKKKTTNKAKQTVKQKSSPKSRVKSEKSSNKKSPKSKARTPATKSPDSKKESETVKSVNKGKSNTVNSAKSERNSSPGKKNESTKKVAVKPSTKSVSAIIKKYNKSQDSDSDNRKSIGTTTKRTNEKPNSIKTENGAKKSKSGTQSRSTSPTKPDLSKTKDKPGDSPKKTKDAKSRKRPVDDNKNSLSGSPTGEPKAKRQLLDKQSHTSPKGLSKVSVVLTDTDDTDSETLYSLGTSAILERTGSKKKLKLNILDIRSSECSTPESERGLPFLTKEGEPTEKDGTSCEICGDVVCGLHYGAHACESCRSFFRRTIQHQTEVKPCLKQCSITATDRRCQGCRFKKCVEAGMSNNYLNSLKYSPHKLKPTLLPITPPSSGNSPYKTPPRTPDVDEMQSQRGDMLDSIPDIPIMPMLPNSPAASHRSLMKRMKSLEADRGLKRSEGAEVERRTSVRQSESAFRYKDIVIKKCQGFTQIWLFTSSTTMKNALNPDVFTELKQALENARKDDSKLVMLSGQGSIFCSGVDLGLIATGQESKLVNSVKEFTSLMISYPKPIVAVVNGPAIGFGAAFLPLCDIVYASDKASFHCPYSRLNQTPEACSSYTFPHLVGSAMANEMLLAGRKLTALEAHQAGLVSHVFWPTSMMQEVVPRLQQMAQTSAKALEASKLLIRSHQKAKLEFTNETECQLLAERWRSAQTVKAVEAFMREEPDLVLL